MVLFPNKRLSYIFYIFLCIYAAFSSFPSTRRSVCFSFFYFSYSENHEDMTGVVMANDSFSDRLFFGNEARYQGHPTSIFGKYLFGRRF